MVDAALPGAGAAIDPADAFLARAVPGRSFADVGGLWGLVNEKVSVAARLGATDLAMIDITLDGPTSLWRQFEQRMTDLGVASYRCIPKDICAVRDLRFDVVHCSGVLYHHPNPLEVLLGLARLTGQWLVLTSATLPGTIENTAGVFAMPSAGAVFVPALADHDRNVLAEHWRQNAATVLGVHLAANFAVDDFAPWWWVPTEGTLKSMCEVCGFTVRGSSPTWNGYAQTLLLEKKADTAGDRVAAGERQSQGLTTKLRQALRGAVKLWRREGPRKPERLADAREGPSDVSAAIEVLKRTDFRDIQRLGFHFQPNDFYSPLADCSFLEENQDLWWERPMPAGIDWKEKVSYI